MTDTTGRWIRKTEPPHRCGLPYERALNGDIWQCDCGQTWTYTQCLSERRYGRWLEGMWEWVDWHEPDGWWAKLKWNRGPKGEWVKFADNYTEQED